MDTLISSTVNSIVIFRIGDTSTLAECLPSLQHLFQRCVNDDPATSSIGFLAPLSDEIAHWLHLQPFITGARPENMLLVATQRDGAVIATVVVVCVYGSR